MTTQLRDGSTVQDPRLGRLIEHDERNRQYPVRALFGDTPPKPRSYTWRVGTWINQGNTSSCVGHAFAHELAARPVVVEGLDHPDALAFYRRAQKLDPWPGEEPAYEGTSVLAGAKAVTETGHYTGYRWAFAESQVALTVGYKGPVVMGTEWYADMMEPDSRGYIHPTGGLVGGHAYLIHRIDLRNDDYVIWNSWGLGWGRNGTARIKRADLAHLLSADGECCLPVRKAR